MKALIALILLVSTVVTARAQQPAPDEKIKELERKLDQAASLIQQLTGVVESLRADIAKIKGDRTDTAGPDTLTRSTADQPALARRIIEPELGHSERGEMIKARPEIFIQTRYSVAPIRRAGAEFEPNLSLTRIEARWAGQIAPRVGAGLEIQLHPALDGSPEELVNDAFIEYYVNDHAGIRAGQFIKPFGFDIQQSSAVRESPERGMLAGYFFPGQRDRGVMLFGNLDFLHSPALKNIDYFVAAFNGNRFFADTNRQMTYVMRARKLFDGPRLAMGVSLQTGKQVLPEDERGDNNERIIGADVQYARGRFGLRGEFAAGNMPSTLLSLEGEFAPAFRPGLHSSGGYLLASYEVTSKDSIYARYDQFNGDPVSGRNIRAFNIGYFRTVGEYSRLSFDYQLKTRPSFNDDAVNGRLNVTWGIEF